MNAPRQTRWFDPPRSDLRRGHGRGLDGYFWRLSHPPSGRVLVVFAGVSQPGGAPPWANLGIAAHPAPVLAAADVDSGGAALDRFCVRAGADPAAPRLLATPERLELDLGPDAGISVWVRERREWSAPLLGGVGAAQLIPGLAHYWHPWLLGAAADGSARLGNDSVDLTGWQVYGEHTWGRGGFPPRWWWGQAHGFASDPGRCVAFAGGTVSGHLPGLEATAIVVSDGARRWVFGNPFRAPVRAEVTARSWRLRGVAPGWRVDLEGEVDPGAGDLRVLPVPDLAARVSTPAARQHLAGRLRVTLRRRGRVVFDDESGLAGLEAGEVSRRSG